ncbi:MAG: cytochrome d ubiquinol oxidase subunit II, partial [Stellaceae bacterium]
ALVFGIAFGNLLLGVPFAFDDELRVSYGGGFLDLLSPFGVLAGLVSVTMLTMHGGAWLALKTDGLVALRAGRVARFAGLAASMLFALAGWWVAAQLDGYVLGGTISHIGPSNPLGQTVTRVAGGWLGNFRAFPWLGAAPALGIVGPLLVAAIPGGRARKTAFVASGAGVAGIIATAGIAMFPFLMPSSTSPGTSLTVWNASSSAGTLFVMLIATVVILPVVLAYTAFALRFMRGRVRLADVVRHDGRY